MLYPITFSIPEEKIVSAIPTKTRLLAILNPSDPGTYVYTDEHSYYQGYRESYFALTMKKRGWDCIRHYEIMANGCIPVFEDIESCPIETLTYLPKDLFVAANALYERVGSKGSVGAMTSEEVTECQDMITAFLVFTRANLTTAKMARNILQVTHSSDAQRILFISGCIRPDYLRCLVLHGFKTVFGTACHDFPFISHLYADHTLRPDTLYGQGFTYSALLDPSLHDDEEDVTVAENIRQHVYDVVIYGSYHRGKPLYDIVTASYAPSEVIFLCGEDVHDCTYSEMTDRGHYVFVRELGDDPSSTN